MPATKKSIKKKIVPPPSISDMSVPTVPIDAPLAVEKELHGVDSDSMDAVVDAPIEKQLSVTTFDEPVLERKNRVLFISGVVLSLCISIGAVVLFIISLRTPKQTSQSPSRGIVTPFPMPTVAQLVRADIVLDVLNGSGISGKAAKVAATLSLRGYKIATVGNASIQETTTMMIKDSLLVKDLLLADIATSIPEVTAAGTITEGTAAARIILGKK